jgi:hypothetical protein
MHNIAHVQKSTPKQNSCAPKHNTKAKRILYNYARSYSPQRKASQLG